MHTIEQLRSGALAGIRRLDLSCGFEVLPPEVFDLADTLEVLNLSGNRLSSLPHGLSRLHRLKVIFGSNNPFTRLPDVLGECAALEVVGFKACRIAEVPAQSLPPRLRWLTLTDNAVRTLPATLGERAHLQKLLLAGNQLQSLPDSLADANQLELLRISANRFPALPSWLFALPHLSWLALAGNPLGWDAAATTTTLPHLAWGALQVQQLLGEGASGHIYRVDHPEYPEGLALKLFKGAVTSDGLPEHELAASLAAGAHPALNTPCATLADHPEGTRGFLLPLLGAQYVNLAGPPSLESCTRDVFAPTLRMEGHTALQVARHIAEAVAHLHQRGVLHDDLYAHNILWNPASAHAMLTDFGAATLLPGKSHPAHGNSQALKAIEVRAMGCLLEELAGLVDPATPGGAEHAKLAALAELCTVSAPTERPTMDYVAELLRKPGR